MVFEPQDGFVDLTHSHFITNLGIVLDNGLYRVTCFLLRVQSDLRSGSRFVPPRSLHKIHWHLILDFVGTPSVDDVPTERKAFGHIAGPNRWGSGSGRRANGEWPRRRWPRRIFGLTLA